MSRKKVKNQVNQLDLLEKFERLQRRDEKLVDELIKHIDLFKYYRAITRLSFNDNSTEIQELFNQVLYWTAFLAFKKARFVEAYKGKDFRHFQNMTQEKTHLGLSESFSAKTLAEYYLSGNNRLKTILMAYKDLLSDDRQITKRILDNFDKIHDLAV